MSKGGGKGGRSSGCRLLQLSNCNFSFLISSIRLITAHYKTLENRFALFLAQSIATFLMQITCCKKRYLLLNTSSFDPVRQSLLETTATRSFTAALSRTSFLVRRQCSSLSQSTLRINLMDMDSALAVRSFGCRTDSQGRSFGFRGGKGT